MKIDKTEVYGFEAAIRGARNPMNSWDRSDSYFESYDEKYVVGPNDLDLAQRLIKAGTEHSKFLRFITVWADWELPLYVWKQMDCYKFIEKNSTSTMHMISSRHLTLKDFEGTFPTNQRKPKQEFIFENKFEEIWESIPGYKGEYLISSSGRVKNNKNKLRKLQVDNKGYVKIALCKKGEVQQYAVHRLVAQTFISNSENKLEVNHKDGNKLNNCISNLEWCTSSENQKHAFSTGLQSLTNYSIYKSKEALQKLTNEQTKEIKELYVTGEYTHRKLAGIYKVSHTTIGDVLRDKTYQPIELSSLDILKIVIEKINKLIDLFSKTKDKEVFNSIIQLLPSSYLQKRTIITNYAELRNVYKQRYNHKLSEWHKACDWIESLPYATELITYGLKEGK